MSRVCGKGSGSRTAGQLELHLSVRFGVSIPALGAAVQQRVADYLERMTDAGRPRVNVVVDEVDGAA